jgi:hypothetical protein
MRLRSVGHCRAGIHEPSRQYNLVLLPEAAVGVALDCRCRLQKHALPKANTMLSRTVHLTGGAVGVNFWMRMPVSTSPV